MPVAWSWAVMRRFHEAGAGTFAATRSLREELARRGFTKVRAWTRGVDLARFRPEPREPWDGLERPVFLYAGRVAVGVGVSMPSRAGSGRAAHSRSSPTWPRAWL